MNRTEFRTLAERGLLLDGATGSNLFAAGMPRGVSTEDWVLDHPAVLNELQCAYAAAGSQLLCAPTFAASRFYRQDAIAPLNRRLVRAARAALPEGCMLAGDVTTAARADYEYDDLLTGYKEQITALRDAGCDAILIETMMGQQEAMAALEAARTVCDLPVLCSFSVSADGGLYFGGDVFEAAQTLEALGADAVGVNCSSGPDQLESVIRHLCSLTSLPVIAKPNAGMPQIDAQGIAVYPMDAPRFAGSMAKLLAAGAKIVGGCCGTTPAHIAALREVLCG